MGGRTSYRLSFQLSDIPSSPIDASDSLTVREEEEEEEVNLTRRVSLSRLLFAIPGRNPSATFSRSTNRIISSNVHSTIQSFSPPKTNRISGVCQPHERITDDTSRKGGESSWELSSIGGNNSHRFNGPCHFRIIGRRTVRSFGTRSNRDDRSPPEYHFDVYKISTSLEKLYSTSFRIEKHRVTMFLCFFLSILAFPFHQWLAMNDPRASPIIFSRRRDARNIRGSLCHRDLRSPTTKPSVLGEMSPHTAGPCSRSLHGRHCK